MFDKLLSLLDPGPPAALVATTLAAFAIAQHNPETASTALAVCMVAVFATIPVAMFDSL